MRVVGTLESCRDASKAPSVRGCGPKQRVINSSPPLGRLRLRPVCKRMNSGIIFREDLLSGILPWKRVCVLFAACYFLKKALETTTCMSGYSLDLTFA